MRKIFAKLDAIFRNGQQRSILAAICAHSVSISIGICQGYSAILIPQLTKSEDFAIDAEQSSWLASLGAITNPIGSILSGVLAEYLGRKRSIQISGVPMIVGCLCIALSANNIVMVYTGRLITGIAGGMSAACYTYVSEISLPNYRGFLQALGPISASFGILYTYTAGWYLSWNAVALLSTAFGLFTLISMQFLPESPAKLFKSGKREECLKSLEWLRRNPVQARKEYDAIVDNNNSGAGGDAANGKERNNASRKEFILSSNAVRPFFLLVALFLLQALSGIYSILFYAVNFFRDSDIIMDENQSTIVFAAVRLVMSIIGAVLINFYGRKSLLLLSSGGMAASLLIAFAYHKYYEHYSNGGDGGGGGGGGDVLPFTNLPLICIFTYVLFTMIGMLPIPWILVGELFPLRIRSIMSGIVICIAQCFIFICVKLYPYMIDKLQFSGTLFSFFVGTFLTMIVCKLFLPETKNKTLEEIERCFSNEPHGNSSVLYADDNVDCNGKQTEVPKENLYGSYRTNLTI